MRARALAAAAFLASILLGGCLEGVAGFGRREEGDQPAFSWNGPATEVLATLGDPAKSGAGAWPAPIDVAPVLHDIDGDGAEEVLVQDKEHTVHVYSGATGRLLADLPVTVQSGWDIERVLNRVAAGTLRPGEPPSIVTASHAAYVAAWAFEPSASNSSAFTFRLLWEHRMTGCYGQPSMDAMPVLADLTGDGVLEILVETEEVGFFALNANGTTLWKRCWAGGNSEPVASDVDGDGTVDAIFASDTGQVSVFHGDSGELQWTFDAATQGVKPASIPVAPTVAELDGRSPKEVLFIARNAPSADPGTWPDSHMAIFSVHASRERPWEATVHWTRQPEWANPLSYTQLVVTDVEGDGSPDIFGMDWNTIGHKPGDWERLGDAHVFRLTAEGEDVWVRSLDTWWSNKPIAVADVDGDGKAEVLANGPSGGKDGFWRLSAGSGTKEGFLPLPGWKVERGPVLGDVDGDGSLDLLASVEPALRSRAGEGAVVVVDLGAPVPPSLSNPVP